MTIDDRDAEDATAADAFAARLDRYFRDNYRVLVRRHLRMGSVDQVEEAIQHVLLRIYERYVDEDLTDIKNLDAYVNTAIRNFLLDRLQPSKTISIEDYGGDAGWDVLKLKGVNPEDIKGWQQLFGCIFDRLPPKYADVAAMAMKGDSPEEISAAHGGQDGYVLRRYARDLVCNIVSDLAARGDPLASAFGRDFCKPKEAKRASKASV